MRTDAQKRADAKYMAVHRNDYKKWSVSLKPTEIAQVDNYIESHKLNKRTFILNAIKEKEDT